MPVDVRWITVNGEKRLRITVGKQPAIIIEEDDAWQLTADIRWQIMVVKPNQDEE